jgi:phenylacetate-CoA ligase
MARLIDFFRHRRSVDFLAKYSEFLDSQWWSLGSFQNHQNLRLRSLLEHAAANVPYYSKLFSKCGVGFSDFSDQSVLNRIPVLTKKDIQENFEGLRARNIALGDVVPNSTGGSTGMPLNFFQDENYSRWSRPAMSRAWRDAVGVELEATEAVFWGAMRDIGKDIGFLANIYRYLRNGRISLNTFDMDDRSLERFLRICNLFKPEIVRGYATSLAYAAEFIAIHGKTIYQPKAIISSTEVLHSQTRQKIEEAFRAPVFDSYGCREIGQIAMECSEHDGLHVVMENQIVELIEGKIIVTNLHNYGMPFIRYEVGDLAAGLNLEPCACGRKSVRLTKLVGRDNDNIVLKSGKIINGEFFEFLFFGCKSVRQYQVIYRRVSDKLLVRVSLRDQSEGVPELIKNAMREKFGYEHVEIVESATFDKTPTGKLRFVYSIDS